ncbi:MAG: heme biosynthesis protein HemY [Rhodospirillales bacterium RIFCSPLOWO2_02_FULL_58_16]|nr:MAG: heme biosynthesis protein HemY [Rhodospirillales bacterium RIFCSPLOWO2_02_FULL_58_16]
MSETATTSGKRGLGVSESAAERISQLIAQEGNAAMMLRVSVSGGGCAGFQYGFSLDDKINDDDRVFEENGVKVVVDDMSLGLVAGARLDFVNDMMGSYFSLNNPNASSTCGCGSSFAV